MTDGGGACGLVVAVEAGTGAVTLLAAALGAAAVASVIIAPAAGHEPLDAAAAGPLVQLAQSHGVAALIADDVGLARTLKADGVHLSWSASAASRLREARETLGSRFIAGADAGRSRDDAMSLGEQGADYVAFGVPDVVKEQAMARERRLALVAWWSEIFEVPCVALDVGDPEEAAALAQSGCDFVAVRLGSGEESREATQRVAAVARAIASERSRG